MADYVELDYCEKCDYLFPTRTEKCPACSTATIAETYFERMFTERIAFIFAPGFIMFLAFSLLENDFESGIIAALGTSLFLYSTYYTAKLLFDMDTGFKELIKIDVNQTVEPPKFSIRRFFMEFLYFPLIFVKLGLRIIFIWW